MQAPLDAAFFGLQGKAALVLGGGMGMGESTARLLSRAGCRIAVADLVEERSREVAARINADGGQAIALSGDVTDDAVLKGMIASAEQQLGGLDAMLTVIGQATFGNILDLGPDDWDRDHRRNLRYFFVAAREVAASLVRRGRPGTITCVASVNGVRAAPNNAAYGAAKAGLLNLVQSMAVEWAAHGIRVNAIVSGHIVTPRLKDSPEKVERYRNSLVPMKRRGQVDDIANAALFLASDMSRYVTGEALAVDGGYLAANLFETGVFSKPQAIQETA